MPSRGSRGCSPRSAPTRRSCYLDIDRAAVKQMGVALDDVFTTLNANMGSVYINQFNEFGRIWQVNVQALGQFRENVDSLKLLAGPQPRGPDGAARRGDARPRLGRARCS